MGASNHNSIHHESVELRQIVDSSPTLIHTARADGYLDFFNRTWLDFVGQPLESLLGWKWTSYIHPDDIETFIQKWRESIANGERFEGAARIRRADGGYRWLLHQHLALRDSTGTIIKWNGSSVDIHHQRQAEEQARFSAQELERSAFHLAEAQRLAHVGSWVFDPAKGFDFWSDELFRIHGLNPAAEAPGSEQYLALVHPQDRESMASLMKRMPLDRSGFDVTKRIVRPNGEVRYVRCVGNPLPEHGSAKRIGIGIDVTEHELLTQELLRRKVYLEEAEQLSHAGSFGWKPESEEIVWSDEIYRIFEFDPSTRITMDRIVERVHPEDRKLVRVGVERASSTYHSFDLEHRLLFPDGRVKHLRVLAKPLSGLHGDCTEYTGTTVDITDARLGEETLRKSERELRTLVEIIPAHVGTSSPDGTVDFLSESWLQYSGMRREEAMGWGWTPTIHPADVDRVLANWQTGLASGEPVEQELRCQKADGTYHWFLNRSLPLHDDEGRIVKWYGILFDIDELKKTESALHEREHELLGIIDTIPSMVWSVSPTGEVTHISQRVLDYSGLRFEDFLAEGWKRFIHPDDVEFTANALSQALQTGEPYNVVHRLRRADGEYRWYHAKGEPLRGPNNEILQWYGLAIDIDESKRAEDHLRDMRVKLSSASRIATVAELSASIAHELNQPLMSVLANAQAGKRWLAANPPNLVETNTSIERIIRDARSADEVMKHIRGLFKNESFEKKQVDIRKVLNEAARFVHGDPRKQEVPIDWQLDEHLPIVSVDLTQMQQVFVNLISNAIEALDGNQDSPHIIVRASTTDQNQMLIQVIDNGSGVSDQERIFDPFVTTKNNGMGIGLAVSRSIVEVHGGRLWAENNSSGGATFSVVLPVCALHSNAKESCSEQTNPDSLGIVKTAIS